MGKFIRHFNFKHFYISTGLLLLSMVFFPTSSSYAQSPLPDSIQTATLSESPTPEIPELPQPKPRAERSKYPLIAIVSLLALLLLGYLVVFYYFFGVKKLKEALEESEANNILILNNLRADIRFITPDYKVKWYNEMGGSLRRHSDLKQNMECYRAFYGLDHVCDFCPAKEAIATGKSAETTIESPDHRFTSMLATPVFDNENKLTGVVVRVEDVTKDKEREQDLRTAKEKAEESDRLKSSFLANMSHEIRTPLNAIVGFSSILLNEDTSEISEEERKSYSEIIRANSDLLLRLIGDILDISRLETDRVTFNLVPCELITLSNNVISTTRYARQSNLSFVLDAPFTSYELITDVQRLQQVLINLMSNAVKFTSEGTITLSIREDEPNDQVIFSVTDTGCGIPPEKQKKVFERFEKLDEYAQGTGLGLAICKITINLLGGDIWVDENYTQGARFVFTHPRHPQIKEKNIPGK
ncbi:PAS domain-containing sensor histidine kinase [Bacteroides sp. 51]|nr:PAS domain-containing sensor histidine kinase [Bacteroides sp. 51]